MKKSEISQGPWTRIRPLQSDEIDPYTQAGTMAGVLTWGGFRDNLLKVLSYCPRLTQTVVEYANSFIFDPPSFRGDVQEAGFNDRFLKELVICRVSLANRSRYSVTHHAFIGMKLYEDAGRRDEGHRKLLYLHEHANHPDIYTERERVVLDYAVSVAKDAHLVNDTEFEDLRRVLREHNLQDERFAKLSKDRLNGRVDSQIVELTWLIGHFCLLNRYFTALQIPDECSADEMDFGAFYEQVVPQDIRERNEQIIGSGF